MHPSTFCKHSLCNNLHAPSFNSVTLFLHYLQQPESNKKIAMDTFGFRTRLQKCYCLSTSKEKNGKKKCCYFFLWQRNENSCQHRKHALCNNLCAPSFNSVTLFLHYLQQPESNKKNAMDTSFFPFFSLLVDRR